MKAYAFDLLGRAEDAIKVSENNLSISSDSAASRAYYAAFYAVYALFALRDVVFRKHSAVESAVHRDLVSCIINSVMNFGNLFSFHIMPISAEMFG